MKISKMLEHGAVVQLRAALRVELPKEGEQERREEGAMSLGKKKKAPFTCELCSVAGYSQAASSVATVHETTTRSNPLIFEIG